MFILENTIIGFIFGLVYNIFGDDTPKALAIGTTDYILGIFLHFEMILLYIVMIGIGLFEMDKIIYYLLMIMCFIIFYKMLKSRYKTKKIWSPFFVKLFYDV